MRPPLEPCLFTGTQCGGCARCAEVARRIFGRTIERAVDALAGPEARVILHPLLASRGADPDVEAIATRAGGRWVILGELTVLEVAR